MGPTAAGRPLKSVGVVGCGAIGRAVLQALDAGSPLRVAGVASRTRETAEAFLATLRTPPPYLAVDEVIARSDLVVEAAGRGAVADVARRTFAAGKDLMVISIGALLDAPELMEASRRSGCRLLIPSGAIAGLDGVKAACMGRVDRVVVWALKPPHALEGSPYLVERGISLAGLEGRREVFSGPVREACRGFPASVNVAAAVSLAGPGPDKTWVRIVAVPGLRNNGNDVEIEGEFGTMTVHLETVPSDNPRTSKLTAMSILRTLHDLLDPVRVGT